MAGSYDDLVPMPLSSGDGRSDGARTATASLLHGGGGGNHNNNSSSSAPITGSGAPAGGAPVMATFELERFGGAGLGSDDEDDDDLLLEWDARAARRWQLCGADCTWAMRFVPERFHDPPDWWFRLGRRQRLAALYGSLLAVAALLALVVIAVPAAATALARSGGGSSRSKGGGGGAAVWPRAPLNVDPGSSPYCAWNELRLPDVVLPRGYALDLAADPRAPERGVNGTVRVRLKPVAEPTPCVVLHAAGGVNITAVRLIVTAGDDDGGSGIGGGSGSSSISNKKKRETIAGRVARTNDFEQTILEFPEAVPIAPYAVTLELAFSYPLREALDGLYLSRYTDAGGANHSMASTHFEALAARRAFPCFDEPALKAPFSVRVKAPPAPWAVLSNMPLKGAASGTSGRRRLRGDSAAAAAGKPAAAAASDDAGDDSSGSSGGDGLATYEFETSPPMSTYLVAVVIGRLEAKRLTCEAGAAKALPVAAWATPERAGQLGTALDAACASLRAFEAALGVPYPLPKLDLVGVPNFQAGAMENWGLITYREARMLVDPSENDAAQELRIGTIVAHEAAHQWFGDLVTLGAWEELWLNEGFASYFEYVGADAFRPAAKYFDFFWADTATDGLESDADGAAHPLSDAPGSIKRLDGVDNRFDGVSYSKGAAVLRMLRAYLNSAPLAGGGKAGGNGLPLTDASGAQRMRKLAAGGDGGSSKDPFMRGLSAYLKANAHGAATHADVWQSVGAAAGLPVPDWMSTWTLRRGFPVLSVDAPPPTSKADAAAAAAASGRGASVAGLRLAQLPFHAPRAFEVGTPYTEDMYCNDWSDDPGDSSWWLPVAYYAPEDASGSPPRWHAFNTCDSTLPITLPKSSGSGPAATASAPLVIANAGRTGFYRVNYSQPLWDALIAAAAAAPATTDTNKAPPRVAAVDLAGAIDDAHALMMARQLDGTVFLRLTAALGRRRAPNYAPWSAAVGALRRLHGVLATAGLRNATWDECAGRLRAFASANVTGPFLRDAAMPNAAAPGLTLAVDATAPLEARLLRPLVLTGAGELGLKTITEAARVELFSDKALHPDVRGAAYKLAVLSGDGDAFEKVLELYRRERAPPVKAELLSALARAPTPALAERALNLALSADVQTQDIGPLVAGVGMAGGAAFAATWRFVYARADDLIARFAGGGSMYSLGRKLNDLAPLFVDDASLDAAADFAAKRPGVLSPTFLDSARAALQLNQAWLLKQGPAVCGWLRDATGGGEGGGEGGGDSGSSESSSGSSGDDNKPPSEQPTGGVDDDEEPDIVDDDGDEG